MRFLISTYLLILICCPFFWATAQDCSDNNSSDNITIAGPYTCTGTLTVSNNKSLTISSGTVNLGNIEGSGKLTITVQSGATLNLSGAINNAYINQFTVNVNDNATLNVTGNITAQGLMTFALGENISFTSGNITNSTSSNKIDITVGGSSTVDIGNVSALGIVSIQTGEGTDFDAQAISSSGNMVTVTTGANSFFTAGNMSSDETLTVLANEGTDFDAGTLTSNSNKVVVTAEKSSFFTAGDISSAQAISITANEEVDLDAGTILSSSSKVDVSAGVDSDINLTEVNMGNGGSLSVQGIGIIGTISGTGNDNVTISDRDNTLITNCNLSGIGHTITIEGSSRNGDGNTVCSYLIEVLPVELIYFSANTDNGATLLTWATASEKDNHYFEIQRSVNGKSFETVGKVMGQGTSYLRTDYSFTDSSYLVGKTTYRLKQVNVDGTYTFYKTIFSNVRQANFELKNLSSNPLQIHEDINIGVYTSKQINISIEVFNEKGQMLHKNIEALATGNNLIAIEAKSMTGRILLVRVCVANQYKVIKVLRI